jgi:hypothetical protein
MHGKLATVIDRIEHGHHVTIGAVRYPGIKIHDPRVIRVLEVLLLGGSQVGGWTAKPASKLEAAYHRADNARQLLNSFCRRFSKLESS